MKRLEIGFATTQELKKEVYRLRYEVYVTEMRRFQKFADHDQRTIVEPLDAYGRLVYAAMDGEIVGTLRMNYYRDGDLEYYPELYKFNLFDRDLWSSFSMTTKLIVKPELRAGTLGTRLALFGYEAGLKDGIAFDFIDCNPHLETYFHKLGYLRYTERIDHPEYGNVLPLVLPFTDFDHLKAVGSPFANVLDRRRQLFTQTTRQLQGEYACQPL